MAQEAERELSELLILPELPKVLEDYPKSKYNFQKIHEHTVQLMKLNVFGEPEDHALDYGEWKLSMTKRIWISRYFPRTLTTLKKQIGLAGFENDEECTGYFSSWRLIQIQAPIIIDIIDLQKQGTDKVRTSILCNSENARVHYVNAFNDIRKKLNTFDLDGPYNKWVEAIKLSACPMAPQKHKEYVLDAIVGCLLNNKSGNWKDELTSRFDEKSLGKDNGASIIRDAFNKERTFELISDPNLFDGDDDIPTQILVNSISKSASFKLHKLLSNEYMNTVQNGALKDLIVKKNGGSGILEVRW